MGIEDQTRACPVPADGAASDGPTGAPRPSGPTHSGEARRTAHSPSAPFSPADLALVELIAEGLSSAAVATRLGLTTAQIKNRIEDLIHQHDAGNRAGLVAVACRGGQIDGGPMTGSTLPPRLAVVLAEVAAGRWNREIARRLHLSLDGVKSRVRALLAWLGANSRAHAVLLAHRAGLLRAVKR